MHPARRPSSPSLGTGPARHRSSWLRAAPRGPHLRRSDRSNAPYRVQGRNASRGTGREFRALQFGSYKQQRDRRRHRVPGRAPTLSSKTVRARCAAATFRFARSEEAGRRRFAVPNRRNRILSRTSTRCRGGRRVVSLTEARTRTRRPTAALRPIQHSSHWLDLGVAWSARPSRRPNRCEPASRNYHRT